MGIIILTQKKECSVSQEDHYFLISWSWCAQKGSGNVFYAARRQTFDPVSGGRNRKIILMHRVIMERILGHSDFEEVDHIDGDSLNNQRDNLRVVTHKQNLENRKGANKNSKSGIRGVSWDKSKQKWQVEICTGGSRIFVGRFDIIEEAEKAAVAARAKYFTHHTQ
jgi:hypothetical protein